MNQAEGDIGPNIAKDLSIYYTYNQFLILISFLICQTENSVKFSIGRITAVYVTQTMVDNRRPSHS